MAPPRTWPLLLALAACRSGEASPTPPAPTPAPTLTPAPTPTPTPALPPLPAASGWCIEGFQELDGEGTCFYLPEKPASPRRLLVYLHGTIPPEGGAPRRNVQQVVLANAKKRGYAALVPRGRRGIGPNKIPEWWSWPTASNHHKTYARGMVDAWLAQKKLLESRAGAPFERTYLAGSSNGAYFLTVLAIRGEIAVDGFAATSGGSSGGKTRAQVPATHRPPFYVGWGAEDESKVDPMSLASTLKDAGWAHRASELKTGHGAREAYLDEAFDFWAAQEAKRDPAASTWCEASVGALSDDTCFALAPKPGSKLMIFLHGVIEPNQNTQWAQHAAAASRGNARGWSVMMPRGKRGLGPGGIEGWYAWPTTNPAHDKHAADFVASWRASKKSLETMAGAPFARTYLIGFSNGGYFTSTLAVRGDFEAAGFGAISGASPSGRTKQEVEKLAARPPFYLGFGSGDDTKTRSVALAALFKETAWPHLVSEHRNAGHSLAESYFDEALSYWDAH